MILVREQDSSNILLHGNGRLCGEVAHFFKDLGLITDKDFTTLNGVSRYSPKAMGGLALGPSIPFFEPCPR